MGAVHRSVRRCTSRNGWYGDNSMTPRDRRAILWGAVVVIVGLGGRLTPVVAERVRNARDGLEARAAVLTRMRVELGDSTRLQDSAEAVRKQVAGLAGSVLTGGSGAEAGASLGALVSMAAERHRVRLSRTDALADSGSAGPARRVSVRATLESDSRGLLELLRAIAAGPATLTVDEVRVAADAPGPKAAELLHIEITIHGWHLPRSDTQ
jgi:hypothetical protein